MLLSTSGFVTFTKVIFSALDLASICQSHAQKSGSFRKLIFTLLRSFILREARTGEGFRKIAQFFAQSRFAQVNFVISRVQKFD